jgi:hypothetical protein
MTESTTSTDLLFTDLSTKVIKKSIFAIHDTIEDFLITGKNQLITMAGKVLRMCRIPDESNKVRERERERARARTKERKARQTYVERCIYSYAE